MQRTDRNSIGAVLQRFRRIGRRYRQLVAVGRTEEGDCPIKDDDTPQRLLQSLYTALRHCYDLSAYTVEKRQSACCVRDVQHFPVLIVEMVEGDEDREVSAGRYSTSGFPEYWRLNSASHCLEVCCDVLDATYQTRQVLYSGALVCPPGASRTIALARLLSRNR